MILVNKGKLYHIKSNNKDKKSFGAQILNEILEK